MSFTVFISFLGDLCKENEVRYIFFIFSEDFERKFFCGFVGLGEMFKFICELGNFFGFSGLSRN